MEADEAVEALLTPWWRAFPSGSLILSHEGEYVTDRVATAVLEVPLSAPGDQDFVTWRQHCEALSLLFLASAMEPRVFFRMAKAHCRYDPLDFTGSEPRTWQLRVLIFAEDFAPPHAQWPVEALSVLLFPPDGRSKAYKTTRRKLLERVKRPEEYEKLVFPMVVWIGKEVKEAIVASTLRRIVQLHTARVFATRGTRSLGSCFFVDSVDLRVRNLAYSDALISSMELVAATPGLGFQTLDFGGSRKKSSDSSSIHRWMQAATGSSRDNSQSSRKRRISIQSLSDHEFAQFCAALIRSRDVHKVVLTNVLSCPSDHWNPAHRWAWLLYTLFRPESQHSVTSVSIVQDAIQLSDILSLCVDTSASDPLNDTTARAESPQPSPIRTHSVGRLVLSLKTIEDCGVKALLELVGWPLTHLSLSLHNQDAFDESYLAHVLNCSPNLVRLEAHSLLIDSFQPFLDAYESNQCRISSLELTRCLVRDRHSVFAFVDALRDPQHAITKTLRYLELQLGQHTAGMSDGLLMSFLFMLQVNCILQVVVLFVSKDQYDRFEPRFRALNGFIRRPLSLSAKYAFLSNIKQEKETTTPRAIGQLDSLVVSKIFAFASEEETRTVVLHVDE
ncbi:hypothetical protein Poli38472_013729 [Pythium oligandrum]|uniref:Uncharacterized protein n=1 Tax=Pythium oligandrum TaxID=41045 RepID=A0A8K1CD92_PYTOL|nr:hypothetical protein Poli38472_013729 [Pythium oligandrum]|eukprot:TMW61266.1 hypothetical protein Poli38472_013729 [Pythium oligandrum]